MCLCRREGLRRAHRDMLPQHLRLCFKRPEAALAILQLPLEGRALGVGRCCLLSRVLATLGGGDWIAHGWLMTGH